MTDHKKILEMIESVDPSDVDAMDKISCAVNRFRISCGIAFPFHLATSRDGLKAIRPEGWFFEMMHYDDGVNYAAWRFIGEFVLDFRPEHTSKTEELAELHVIIQAIAYEMGLA